MRKLEKEENIREFDYALRCYNDVLRWGVRHNHPDEVSQYKQARRERLNRIIELLLLDSKTQNINVLERAFKLAYEHCCLHAHEGDLDSAAIIDLVDDFEEFYLTWRC
jgi:hypothetical protein